MGFHPLQTYQRILQEKTDLPLEVRIDADGTAEEELVIIHPPNIEIWHTVPSQIDRVLGAIPPTLDKRDPHFERRLKILQKIHDAFAIVEQGSKEHETFALELGLRVPTLDTHPSQSVQDSVFRSLRNVRREIEKLIFTLDGKVLETALAAPASQLVEQAWMHILPFRQPGE